MPTLSVSQARCQSLATEYGPRSAGRANCENPDQPAKQTPSTERLPSLHRPKLTNSYSNPPSENQSSTRTGTTHASENTSPTQAWKFAKING